MSPCRRLEGDPRHAGDPLQALPHLPQEGKRPLTLLVGEEGVEIGEPGMAREVLVELGVVLHRARAQRVEPRVHPVVHPGEGGVVADEFRLRDRGEAGRTLPP
jgi:hypothetical protein